MDLELIVKFSVLIFIILFFIARSRFTRHYKKFTPNFLVKYILAFVLFLLYLAGYFDFALLDISLALRLFLGGTITIFGAFLFFWSHYHLNINWSPVIEKKFAKSRKLVDTGPYKYVRHPIYTASFIVLLGLFIFSANWILTGLPLVVLIIFYLIKVPREEDELVRNFGREYKEYTKHTWKFLPGL